MAAPVSAVVGPLTRRHRVLLLGGLAVIAHGHSRHTQDADVWLEPMTSPEVWLTALRAALHEATVPLAMLSLPGWRRLEGEDQVNNVADTGLIRVSGLIVPLDVFRRPNQLKEIDFDEMWNAAAHQPDGTRLPHAAHLLTTKEQTGRPRDFEDNFFLISKAREECGERLAGASESEAAAVLDEFFDHEVGRRGLANGNPSVRASVVAELERLVEEGDLLSAEVLDEYRRRET